MRYSRTLVPNVFTNFSAESLVPVEARMEDSGDEDYDFDRDLM